MSSPAQNLTSPGSEIGDRVRALMAEVFEAEPSSIDEAFARDEAPAWDSLNHLRLMTALEEAFAVSFTMREIETLRRCEDICRLLARRLDGS